MEKRHNAASEQTEHELASALKTLMAQMPIDKITIRELAELSGIRRQNFYYHFDDIYDLMCWMFREEAISLIGELDKTPDEIVAFLDQTINDHIRGAFLRLHGGK